MTHIEEQKYYNQYPGRILILAAGFTGAETGCRLKKIKR
jgi:hypothetical protein